MHVTYLAVYPVKSTRGMPLTSATVEPWGLTGDRRWAVVDEQGEKVTARERARLLHVTGTPTEGDGLLLTAPDMEPLAVEAPWDGERTPVDFSGLDEATLAGEAADTWLSQVVDTKVRLVWLDDPRRRPVAERHGGRPGDTFNLADTGPLLLTTVPSLHTLDGWIDETAAERDEPSVAPLAMTRFRPNVVIDGTEPFAEDDWHEVHIGDVRFRVSEACDRCVLPTIDPETLHRAKEPTRTLARHRRRDGKVWFGVRLVPVDVGEIHVGDAVVGHAARSS